MVFLYVLLLTWGAWNIPSDPALFAADLHFCTGRYAESILEYKRYIFFHPGSDDATIGDAYYKLGICYRNTGEYEKSIPALRTALDKDSRYWSRDEKEMTLAAGLCANNQLDEAEFLLLKIEMFSERPDSQKSAALLRAVVGLYARKWDHARDALNTYLALPGENDQAAAARIEEYLKGLRRAHFKSPRTAQVLSGVLPGSGQLYAGAWKDGLNAMAINGIFGAIFFQDVFGGRYLDALLGSFLVFRRFYMGNIRNAGNDARNHNTAEHERLARRLLDGLENGDE